MNLKAELKNSIHERFHDTTSILFQKNVLTIIDGSADDRAALLRAAEKISILVGLFIDKGLEREVLEELTSKIDSSGRS